MDHDPGRSGGASEVMTSYVYRTAFQTQKFGTATAASIVMMVVMIAATVGLQVLKRGKKEKTDEENKKEDHEWDHFYNRCSVCGGFRVSPDLGHPPIL